MWPPFTRHGICTTRNGWAVVLPDESLHPLLKVRARLQEFGIRLHLQPGALAQQQRLAARKLDLLAAVKPCLQATAEPWHDLSDAMKVEHL